MAFSSQGSKIEGTCQNVGYLKPRIFQANSYVQSQLKEKRVVFGKNPTSLLFVVPFQGPQVKYSRCSIGADKLPTVAASNWHSHLSYAMPQSSIRRYSVLRSPVPKRKIARREASSSSEEVEYEQ
jgi:hypothetical protein